MSKASQRRLAQQQKRQKNRKQGDLATAVAAAEDYLLLGPSAIRTDPVKYWTTVSKVQTAGEVPCPDDDFEYLSERLDDHKDFLASWAKGCVSMTGDGLGLQPGPGLLIVDSYPRGTLTLPYSPAFNNISSSDPKAIAGNLLDTTRQIVRLEEDDFLICSIFGHVAHLLMASLVISASGACMTGLYVRGTWIKSKFITPFVAIHDNAYYVSANDTSDSIVRRVGERDIHQLLSSDEVRGDANPSFLPGLGPQLSRFINSFAGEYLEHAIRLADVMSVADEAIEGLEKNKHTVLSEERAQSRKSLKHLQEQLESKNTEIVKLKTEMAVLKGRLSTAPTMKSTVQAVSPAADLPEPAADVNSKMLTFFDM